MSKNLEKFIIFDVIIIAICGLIAFFFFNKSEKAVHPVVPQQQSPASVSPTSAISVPVKEKIWRIVLSYHPQSQQFTLATITIAPGTAKSSPFHTSEYTLAVFDKSNQILFQTDIPLAQQILYDIYFPPSATTSSLPQLEHIDTLIAIPYLTDAYVIRVLKHDQKILEFYPPKEVSFFSLPSVINQAEAASCDPLHIVFISDGYSDMNKFTNDVKRAETTFMAKTPFSTHSNIFDFHTVENSASNPLGCSKNGQLYAQCVGDINSLEKITTAVFTQLPQLPQDTDATKIVILVDGKPEPFPGGGFILGVANTLGGQFGVFQNQQYFETTAAMEVLGHDVGHLYDRYIYPASPGTASDIGNTIPAPFLSNCTTNPQGEAFWRNVGVTQAYPGCTSQYLYAPAPRDCGNAGSSSTLMSAANCGGSQFDGVEQYYITTQILPHYCDVQLTVTPSFTPTPSMSSSQENTSPAYQGYDCQPDPSCNSSKTLQLCPLKCTPRQ